MITLYIRYHQSIHSHSPIKKKFLCFPIPFKRKPKLQGIVSQRNALGQGSENLLCKQPDSKHSGLYRSYGICCNYSTPPLQSESSHRQHVNKQAWLNLVIRPLFANPCSRAIQYKKPLATVTIKLKFKLFKIKMKLSRIKTSVSQLSMRHMWTPQIQNISITTESC